MASEGKRRLRHNHGGVRGQGSCMRVGCTAHSLPLLQMGAHLVLPLGGCQRALELRVCRVCCQQQAPEGIIMLRGLTAIIYKACPQSQAPVKQVACLSCRVVCLLPHSPTRNSPILALHAGASIGPTNVQRPGCAQLVLVPTSCRLFLEVIPPPTRLCSTCEVPSSGARDTPCSIHRSCKRRRAGGRQRWR